MKILEVIPNLHSGGAEKFVLDIVNEFSLNKFDQIVLLTLYDITNKDIFFKMLSSDVVCRSLSKKKGLHISIFWKLMKLIKVNKIDVVHVHVNAVKYILLASILCRNVKFYATIHSDANFEANSFLELLIRKFLFRYNLCTPITISEESQKSFYELYKRNSTLIYNGCSDFKDDNSVKNIREYFDTKKYKVFVNVARIVPVKNQLMLVKVFDRLIKEGYNVALALVGDKSDNDIFNQIKPYLSNRIIFVGLVNNSRAFIKGADFFCLSSNFEGMPISLMEALSIGCIPICTPVGGCVNIIKDSKNGFLSVDLSESEFYNTVLRALASTSSQIEDIKNNVYSTAKQYSIKICAKKYYSLFLNN